VAAANVTRLAVVTTWGGSISGVRRDVVPWMQLMTELGVTHFYVSVELSDAGATSTLLLGPIYHKSQSVSWQAVAPLTCCESWGADDSSHAGPTLLPAVDTHTFSMGCSLKGSTLVPSQVLYDGTDSETVAQLSSIKHVTLLFLAPPFASAGDIEQFAAWQGRHWQWGGKPGNFNLMVKQGECACRMPL